MASRRTAFLSCNLALVGAGLLAASLAGAQVTSPMLTSEPIPAKPLHLGPGAPAPTSAPAAGPSAAPSTAQAGAAPATAAAAGRTAEVQQALQAWRQAWELGDVDQYLRFYDAGFKGDAATRQQWEQQRRARIGKQKVSVRAEDVRTRMLNENEAEVQFVQHYSAGGHADVGDKLLRLRRVDGGWKITQESWKARR